MLITDKIICLRVELFLIYMREIYTRLNMYLTNEGVDMDKKDLFSSISTEIEDREYAQYDTTDEIKELRELKNKVDKETELTYQEYSWLCYCVNAVKKE